MERRNRRCALALAALAVAFPAAAQEAAGARLGIGIGLPTSEIASLFATAPVGSFSPPFLYVPINLTPQIRLEPQLGFLSAKQDGGDDFSVFGVGTGAFFLVPLGGQAQLYVGPRIVFMRTTETNVSGSGITTDTTGNDWWLAAALGGEVMLHPRVSLGGEAQLGYTAIGDRESVTAGVKTIEPGGSSTGTQGVVFVRVYFL